MSSEDEGPCFIDSETPVGWIKTLAEHSNGVITVSRKDLLNDCAIDHSSDSGQEMPATKERRQKVKKKKKPEEKENEKQKENAKQNQVKKASVKISANVKKV